MLILVGIMHFVVTNAAIKADLLAHRHFIAKYDVGGT